ncbi:hypothetical protein TNCV_4306521 [Trichonephila clavipes]|nr:hypothetical protein TNCV_4306521 [Trichonephila clavipes]
MPDRTGGLATSIRDEENPFDTPYDVGTLVGFLLVVGQSSVPYTSVGHSSAPYTSVDQSSPNGFRDTTVYLEGG